MYTWINEQELREIQLGAFEYAVKEEACTGLMMAYNRVGPCECSVSYGLNTTVLQNEWGYKGASVTDGYSAAIGCEKYEHPDLQVRAGAGLLLYTGGFAGSGGLSENTTNTEAGLAMLHDLAKKVIYRHANSNAMRVSRDYTPYWILPVAGINILLIALAVLAFFLLVRTKKDKGGKGGDGKKAAAKAAKTTACLLMLVVVGVSFSACSADKKAQEVLPDVVKDLKFDFESGEFSFSDVVNAKNYNVRVFEANPAEGAADMPVAARRVRDREGYEKYEGFVDMTELTAGDSYKVYVYTYSKDSKGDLVFVTSDPLTGVYKTTYSTPDGTGVTATLADGGVTVDFADDFFTDEFVHKNPSYLVKLYADSAEVDQITLTSAQVETVERQEESSSGDPETVIEHCASVHFDKAGDSVTIQLISTDSTAYYDSAESAPIAATEPAAEEPEPAQTEGGEAAGEAASGDDGFGESTGESAGEAASGDEGFGNSAGEAAPGQGEGAPN